MLKNNNKNFLAFLLYCVYPQLAIVCGKATVPLIVWWYETIFPHVEDGKRLYEVECDNGALCRATSDRNMMNKDSFQTIVFYGSDFTPDDIPLPRRDHQMWALVHEESPQNNFILCQEQLLELFNFTSTFKQASDFPLTTQHIPSIEYFFERIPTSTEVKNKFRQGHAPVVYIQSHCDVPSDRDRYVAELMKHIQIDSYGDCLRNQDFPEYDMKGMEYMHSEKLLELLSKYKFHLTFENAVCDDYVTEKIYRALHVGSVPVYMGARNIDEWTPERSFIKVTDYSSPMELAQYLKLLDDDDNLYLHYLGYKNKKYLLPKKMKDVLRSRRWSATNVLLPHFMSAYECFLCIEMHKIMHDTGDGRRANQRKANKSLLHCPAPKPSLGTLAELNKSDGFHEWVEDYEQAIYQAQALADVIRVGETNSAVVWDYVAEQMMKGLHHNEL